MPRHVNDVYRRLYGDSFYKEDRVVQCEEYNRLYNLFSQDDFQRLTAAAREQRQFEGLTHIAVPQQIRVTIDVDENPIVILYKIKLLICVMREARVLQGLAQSLPRRIKQQLQTLESKLDADLVGDLKRNFRHDDEIFQVWDHSKGARSDSQIAQDVWPDEYQAIGGRTQPQVKRVH